MDGKIEIVLIGGKLKPALADSAGQWVTVRGIVSMILGGVEEKEVIEEMKIDAVDLAAAVKYVNLYPQVME